MARRVLFHAVVGVLGGGGENGAVARLLVDAMNVIGSRPTGWWRDRDAAVAAFLDDLAALGASGEEICVVLDGPLPAGMTEGVARGIEVLAAGRRGPNAADDRIVDRVQADPDPASITVVTADRALRERVRRLGASVSGPVDLLMRIEGSRGRPLS